MKTRTAYKLGMSLGCSVLIAFMAWVAHTIYEIRREPNLLKKEYVGKIVDAHAVGGYRSSPRLEVRTDAGNVYLLNSTPPIKIGAPAYLHTWDKDWANQSLSWEGSGSSWYLER